MPIRRLVQAIVLAGLTAVVPAAVLAHAELTRSAPAAGQALDAAPSEVVLTFDAELDPDRSSLAVTDAAGDEVGRGEVDLQVARRNVLRAGVAIDADGRYAVSWTAVAADGHAESGGYGFTVGDVSPVAPDTAMPRPNDIAVAGIALTVLAGLISLRARRLPLWRP